VKKHLLIPEDDVIKLEEARKALHELARWHGLIYPDYSCIVESMWKITNRKYEVVEKEN
jgi:hypothetical protein